MKIITSLGLVCCLAWSIVASHGGLPIEIDEGLEVRLTCVDDPRSDGAWLFYHVTSKRPEGDAMIPYDIIYDEERFVDVVEIESGAISTALPVARFPEADRGKHLKVPPQTSVIFAVRLRSPSVIVDRKDGHYRLKNKKLGISARFSIVNGKLIGGAQVPQSKEGEKEIRGGNRGRQK